MLLRGFREMRTLSNVRFAIATSTVVAAFYGLLDCGVPAP